jgi:hypothetical protein
MPALPPSSDFTGASVTEGAFKTAITNLRDYLSGLLGSDGTIATAQSTLGMLGGSVVAKSAAYTVVAADRGKVFNCTSTFTLSLTAAGTLGSGFSFIVANIGTGLITIDPSGAETINGAATITVSPGEQVMVTGNGTAFRAFSGFDLGNLTADTAPDTAADYAIVWDASLSTWKKVLIDNLGGGGMKLLGTLNTTSGTSQTLSGLTLTGYTSLFIVGANISFSGASQSVRFAANSSDNQISTDIGTNASGTTSFFATVELLSGTGVTSSASARSATAKGAYVFPSGYGTGTTSIVFYASGYDTGFDAGTIYVYGCK